MLLGVDRPVASAGGHDVIRAGGSGASRDDGRAASAGGAHASHLTVVDESGRELAVVTRWISGMTTVVSPRRGRLGVGYHLGTDGSASVCVQGRERVILPDARADGTPGISRGDLPSRRRPSAMMEGGIPTGTSCRTSAPCGPP